MRVEIIKSFIDSNQLSQLNDWAETAVRNKWLDLGLSRDRFYSKRLTTRFYGPRFVYPELAISIREKIRMQLGLEGAPLVENNHGRDGIVVSYIMDGGDVFSHRDPRVYKELAVLRCNIVSREAEEGGKLVINGEQINIRAGDLHCYLASEHEHYVTEVKGNIPRVIWQFGFCVPVERWGENGISKH